MTGCMNKRAVTLLGAALLLCGPALADINLDWRLDSPAVCSMREFALGLYAVSDSAENQTISAIDVIVEWDPVYVELLGVNNNGPYDWLSSGFPDDSNLDGLNVNMTDGTVFYQALAAFGQGNAAEATPDGLLVTTFQFRAILGEVVNYVEMLPDIGTYSHTRVFSGEVPGLIVTGTIDSIDLLPTSTGDCNCDGLINNFDIDPFVLALNFPDEYHAQYPTCNILNADTNCNGRVDNFDIDPLVELLTNP